MLIAIDAGHGGKDPGAAAFGLQEKDVTLKLALKTGTYLRTHYECEVMYTRNRDVYLTPSERASMANRAKADLFCSIHVNSFNSSSKGFETYRFQGTTGKTAELQRAVHEEIMKVMKKYNVTNRGMKQQNFAVLRETRMSAVLTENLFISNAPEAKLLKLESFLDQIAQAHAIGLAKAAKLKTKKSSYHIVTGDFKNRAEAEKYANLLKKEHGLTVKVQKS